MARAIWTGSIGFGLVQIPVALHAAEGSAELEMTMLDRRRRKAAPRAERHRKSA